VRRALVLGGGGPVGLAWEAGLLSGLGRGGADLANADKVIGTSAGAAVGYLLASGADLSGVLSLVAPPSGAQSPQSAANAADPMEELIAVMAESALHPQDAARLRAQLGSRAVAAHTMSEASWLERFQAFAGAAWPPGFACTTVDTADGAFQVWDQSCGIGIDSALASSCAVPVVFPPVTIKGRRWMDGGVRDFLNADIATGHDVVLAVSCVLLENPGEFARPGMNAVMGATRDRLDALRAGGIKVEAVVPNEEMLQLSGSGIHLMDYSRAAAAYGVGERQGEAAASELRAFWHHPAEPE